MDGRRLADETMDGIRIFMPCGREATRRIQFELGMVAAYEKSSEQDNPYPINSVSGLRWRLGYGMYNIQQSYKKLLQDPNANTI